LTRLLRAVVDTQALRANLRVIRERAPGAQVMAVVKANAYGHGLVPVAQALRDADAFAVARLEEGAALREAGIDRPIVLLEGVFSGAQLAVAREHRLELVAHDPAQLELLEHAPEGWPGILWIKVDTGMNRLGFRPERLADVLARVRSLRQSPSEIRALTHLARADEVESSMTAEQVARFHELTAPLRLVTSIANSAAVFTSADARRARWVRPGLALYGASPIPGVSAASLGLTPAMRFETSVIAVREVPAGETVGYGGTWTAPRATRVAILSAGYGDGVPWGLPSGAGVFIAGQRAALIGRVSMDMIAADVSGLANVVTGAGAVLWGAELPVEEQAASARTIPYTLLCGVSLRVPREYR
jgi:alanine racemase